MNQLPKRKTVRHQNHTYNCGMFFVTICTESKKCLLSRIVGTGNLGNPQNSHSLVSGNPCLDGPRVELMPYGETAKKYIEQLNNFYDHIKVDSYVIMPNHIHLLLFVPWSEQFRTIVPTGVNSHVSRFVSTFKRFCNKEYGVNIWQPRSFDHIIRNQADYQKHKEYIYNNPRNWSLDKLNPIPDNKE